MKFLIFFSTFVGHFCPPGSGSGFRITEPLPWLNPDPIRIRNTGCVNSSLFLTTVSWVRAGPCCKFWADCPRPRTQGVRPPSGRSEPCPCVPSARTAASDSSGYPTSCRTNKTLRIFLLTINAAVVYLAWDVMILMQAICIRTAIGRGGPWNRGFYWGPKKVEISGPTLPMAWAMDMPASKSLGPNDI